MATKKKVETKKKPAKKVTKKAEKKVTEQAVPVFDNNKSHKMVTHPIDGISYIQDGNIFDINKAFVKKAE